VANTSDRQRLGPRLLTVGLLCAGIFVVLAGKASTGVPNRVDRAVADLLMASSGNSKSFRAADVVSIGGSPVFVVAAAIALAALVWTRRRDVRLAAWCVVAPAVAGLLQLVAKELVGPQQPVSYNPDHVAAFPSGHATGAASIATLVIVLTFTTTMPRSRRVAVIAIAIAYPLAVSASRIVLDYHLTLDVVGGLLLGIAVTTLTGVLALHRAQPAERRAARSATS
jgi:membrane-associated phospholipid phosphatase